MNLTDILDRIDYIDYTKNNDDEITNVTNDSRKIEKGGVFVAISGMEFDGHRFIDKAIANGANTIVVTEDVTQIDGINYIKVDDARIALAQISNVVCDFPSKKLRVIGVTGTNGKTTTSSMISHILEHLNSPCTNIGTNGTFIAGEKYETPNTTPEISEIDKILKLSVDKKIDNAVVECSSHGLYLHRLDGIEFDVAVFNNLSMEHMDFHKNMENYFDAKMILFENAKKKIANVDDEYGRKAKARFEDAYTFSLENESDFRAENVELIDGKMHFEIKNVKFVLNRFAMFDVYNAVAAIVAVNLLGYELEDIAKALESFTGVEARFEFINNDKGINIVIDFAHTPKAFENIYKSVPNDKRKIAVYGMSGDRTSEIRHEVGKISAENDVFSVVTTDDPKFDTYENIADDIVSGIEEEKGEFIRIKDRKSAIKHAIEMANEGDFVLLLGKGQENFIKLKGNEKTPYSEKETVNEVLDELRK
ncbi:UDP-N-acetylmuramoyl-L-alanyl-D-glutamate--2,6-diaminopimelate ligase [Finegoldia magna]|uniref:UDP-N-acetylmuramoyl-L-alanyl-D-glutamate--2, 6-diaminopimelate ligase n=1 Tax=Finegoldia magna TaxID=1260 RepID=UPI0029045EF1|nr:UDP-N-acetylmuramoyl-L-alanyl-D-glutamate--2,6-diaminopimelate ligase [Finegoldia magna]MDU1579714.1 UDP-N-acetylmuramoyl-L-alanyl-D-glutamate--2,6-diaminopimelate ligase [Finegoldia magna]MDU1600711.1 UDP-N-acetylmuramoyl-L-alanyl-D-glutamate--2,6-diaminopimelate ligase [Finegoldia magna]MDU6552479.1 UDP-N-acetylmuramoyl-L-alanyl-D-glutamate--2,6-diaminopimelate ligase [Finegoldia magna]